MPITEQQTMQVRIGGETVDREVASVKRAMQADGSIVEHPEPLLAADEVVFRPDDDPAPIIVTRTIPA